MSTHKVEQLEARLKRKDEVIAAVAEELVRTKKTWGRLKETWAPSDERDAVMDFLKRINTLTQITLRRLLGWCELCARKSARWRERYGKANEHNA